MSTTAYKTVRRTIVEVSRPEDDRIKLRRRRPSGLSENGKANLKRPRGEGGKFLPADAPVAEVATGQAAQDWRDDPDCTIFSVLHDAGDKAFHSYAEADGSVLLVFRLAPKAANVVRMAFEAIAG